MLSLPTILLRNFTLRYFDSPSHPAFRQFPALRHCVTSPSLTLGAPQQKPHGALELVD